MKKYILSWKSIAMLSLLVAVVWVFSTGFMIGVTPKTVVFEGACTVEPTEKSLKASCGELKYQIKDTDVITKYMLGRAVGKDESVYCKATHRTFDDEIEWSCSYGKPEEK